MAKLKRTFAITAAGLSGIVGLRFAFDRALQEKIKRYPGVRYAPELGHGMWAAPLELIGVISQVASDEGYAPRSIPAPLRNVCVTLARTDVHEYQRAAAERGAREGALLIAFEPGLGKTVTALEAAHLAGCKRLLIACPAIARRVWQDEILKWGYKWRAHPIETGKEAGAVKLKRLDAVIVSYELADKLPSRARFDAVIIDESHYVKRAGSKRSKQIREIVDANDLRLLLLLTGTPITNEPGDLWAQLDLMYPDRYGSHFNFKRRYAQAIPDEYADSGYRYEGLNPEHADELRARLAWVSERVTADQVGDLLPPLTTQILRIKAKRKAGRDLLDAFDAHRIHTNKFEAHLTRESPARLKASIEWARDAAEQSSHVLIFTYFRATARELAERLNAIEITGALTHKKRHEAIAEARGAERAIVVATMDSVGVAIDLTFARRVLFAELHYTPGTIMQALRRCYRLTSRSHVHVDFLAVRGTLDDVIVRTLGERFRAIASVQQASKADDAIEAALAEPEETEAQWVARMRSIAREMREDLYL